MPSRFIVLFILISVSGYAQDSLNKARTIADAFLKANVHGRFKSVFITDINDGPFTDYYTVAAGGYARIETAPYHHFFVGVGANFTYNLSSSDLGKPDPATGQKSRYEILQVDVQDPYNKINMVRLDWLYAKYQWKNNFIRIGKSVFNTPFINQQDIHMRSTVADGLYSDIQWCKKLRTEIAFIYGISPGATRKWFNIQESIGIYSNGVNPDGTPGNYTANVNSDGIGLIGLHYAPAKKLTIHAWDQYADQIFNTALLQPEYRIHLRRKKEILVAAQVIRQDPLASGGNVDKTKAYFSPDNHSLLLGGRVAYHAPVWDVSVNYVRITAEGRYQMPREWGREPMFTFLMREQIEGAGDVHAFTIRGNYTFASAGLRADAGIGYYNMPDITNAKLSKYSMPTFMQYCATLRETFKGQLKGFETELVWMYKQKADNVPVPGKYIINRVNMTQIAFSLLFNF